MIIFAIETTCDETSFAILKGKKILANNTISQVLEQSKHGGVFPSLAAKLHISNIEKLLKQTVKNSGLKIEEIDYVAYAEKPGLVICLQIGKAIAETIALFLEKPLIKCDHLEAHLYASLLEKREDWDFPALGLLLSGGHSQIYSIEKHLKFELLGETVDDAAGECLDKCAIMMGYSYPGGPIIEKLAKKNKEKPIQLIKLKKTKKLELSFSGLKSSFRRELEKRSKATNENLSYSLQKSIAELIKEKIGLAIRKKKFLTIIVGGGVSANIFLRNYLKKFLKGEDNSIKIFFPKKKYSTDNAAMIGLLAYYKIKLNQLNA